MDVQHFPRCHKKSREKNPTDIHSTLKRKKKERVQ